MMCVLTTAVVLVVPYLRVHCKHAILAPEVEEPEAIIAVCRQRPSVALGKRDELLHLPTLVFREAVERCLVAMDKLRSQIQLSYMSYAPTHQSKVVEGQASMRYCR